MSIKYNSNNDYEFDKGFEKASSLLKSNLSKKEKDATIKKFQEALKDSGGYLSKDPNDYLIGFNVAIDRLNKENKHLKSKVKSKKKNWGKITNINKYKKRKGEKLGKNI